MLVQVGVVNILITSKCEHLLVRANSNAYHHYLLLLGEEDSKICNNKHSITTPFKVREDKEKLKHGWNTYFLSNSSTVQYNTVVLWAFLL